MYGPVYVNVDSPNLGFPYFNFLGGTSEKNTMYDKCTFEFDKGPTKIAF